MFRTHGSVEAPDDWGATIWRYLDRFKFESMLSSGTLHFARGDRFTDPHEEMLTEEQVRQLLSKQVDSSVYRAYLQAQLNIRLDTDVNCWRLSKRESASMWLLYTTTGDAVAIRSTYGRPAASVVSSPQDVHIGMVRYDTTHFPSDRWPSVMDFWVHERARRA
jgi:hypothetical protein